MNKYKYALMVVLMVMALPAVAEVSSTNPLKSAAQLQQLREQRQAMRLRNAKAARDPAAWAVLHNCRAAKRAAKTDQAKAAAVAQCQQGAVKERERLDLQR